MRLYEVRKPAESGRPERIELYSLTDRKDVRPGEPALLLVNETAGTRVGAIRRLEDVPELFVYYMRAEIVAEVDCEDGEKGGASVGSDAERLILDYQKAWRAWAEYPAGPSIGGGDTWNKRRFVLSVALKDAEHALRIYAPAPPPPEREERESGACQRAECGHDGAYHDRSTFRECLIHRCNCPRFLPAPPAEPARGGEKGGE